MHSTSDLDKKCTNNIAYISKLELDFENYFNNFNMSSKTVYNFLGTFFKFQNNP